MRVRTFVLGLGCALLLLAAPAFPQGLPSGTLTGHVEANNGALPGVTVTVASPSLQGSRVVTTSQTGDYNIPFLPPGEYQVTYVLEGFQEVRKSVKISAAQATALDVTMALASVSEEIVVTGTYETVSSTSADSTTYDKKFVEALPVDRNIRDTVLLTPGVSDTGPGTPGARGISISGSQSYENLFLVNGVVINENLRGQPFNLFIEDAIEETTTTTSGISAEYGRFAGGVVNTITKSGGNELHGSFRDNLTNNSWSAKTPLTTTQTDKINPRYEATLGGWLLKDRLWYFGAGRSFKESTSGQTVNTHIPYPIVNDEKRYEGKLTLSPFQGHRLVGSYIKIDRDEQGNVFLSVLDLASVVHRQLPQTLEAFNYTGVITDNFFVEAQYSKRKFTFENSGSVFTDIIHGTLIVDENGFRWNSPTFCGVCLPEKRDNENKLGKASWFVSTKSLGSHDLALGYDTFNDVRLADNHQSGSDFRVFITNTIYQGTTLFPRMLGDDTTAIVWNPILVHSHGTNFRTNSFYLNDRWRLNEHWSFNLGARRDANDGVDSEGKTVAKDSKISPRLGATYDPKGNGNWVFNASYGDYVAALANTQGDATSRGGNPATFVWGYFGPAINAPGTPLVPTDQALQQLFNWFNSVGGVNNTSFLESVSIPGGTTRINGSLDSPSTREYSLGVTKRLGNKGVFRSEYVYRKSQDFYFDRIDLTTGRVTTATGTLADLAFIENNNSLLSRKYSGLQTQAQYRMWDRLNLGATWTWSHTYGNVNGETSGSGPVRSAAGDYPQYKDPHWNNPVGDLGTDQRHRVRAWAIYDIFKNSHNQLSVGLLQNYYSGLPYGAVGAVDSRAGAGNPTGVVNPGYVRPPTAVTYYYTARDAFHTPSITQTDLTLNYSFQWNAFSKTMEVFLQPEVLNVLNEHGVLNVNTSVVDPTTNRALPRFNPFTTTPVEGVNWRKGPLFGQPVNDTDYQTPRTFRFSVGLRF
jgi:carboxypeptidase family protein/TonB-dependent receptor-like protein